MGGFQVESNSSPGHFVLHITPTEGGECGVSASLYYLSGTSSQEAGAASRSFPLFPLPRIQTWVHTVLRSPLNRPINIHKLPLNNVTFTVPAFSESIFHSALSPPSFSILPLTFITTLELFAVLMKDPETWWELSPLSWIACGSCPGD